MTELNPRAILRVYDDHRDAFGAVLYPGETISWSLPGLMGTPGASFSGLVKNPSGSYLMQQPVGIPADADPSQWTNADGSTLGSAFSYGTDPATGKKFLYHASISDAWNVKSIKQRVQDEGFYAAFYVGQATASTSAASGTSGANVSLPNVSFFAEFSRGRQPGEPGLRLALEPGKFIRLQESLDDDETWNDVGAADSLGDCESYLAGNAQVLYVSVLAMTDQSWYDNLPASLASGGQPPNLLQVSIGRGDAVLTITRPALAAGCLAVTGKNRQWSARPSAMRFASAATATLASQVRPAQFGSDPSARLSGYVPGDGSVSVGGRVIVDTPNSAHVEMSLTATPDATGYALRSCFLSAVYAEFPPVQQTPGANPSYIDYPLIYCRCIKRWDQTSGTVRMKANVVFSNQHNEFAPGTGAALGVRAATLLVSNGTDAVLPGTVTTTIDGVTYAAEMTGWTAMEDSGQVWSQSGYLLSFSLSLSDKLVHTEDDTAICCGFQLPYDFECQYYAFGQQAYRLGICDALWEFPLVRRGDQTPYYYLDGGTTGSPVHQFPPDMTLGQSMQHVRSAGAEFDPISQGPVPMIYGTDAVGRLLFFGMPAGVVSMLSDPAKTLADTPELLPAITFSAVPEFSEDGTALLNEFVQTWSSRSSLRRVRTPVVVVGLDPQSGSAVFGVAYNEKLGGGPYADPSTPGYIGIDKPLYVVSRMFTSQGTADLAVRNASVQLAAPAIDSGGRLHVQPGLAPLTVVAVNDYSSQGTTNDVGFYLTEVDTEIDNRNPYHYSGSTLVSGRILGLSS